MTTRRNDPCPCGSGKKYKRCCLGTDHDPAAGEIPKFGGLTPEQFVALDHDVYERACELDREGQRILNTGAYERALAKFEEAIDLVPTMTFWHNNRALALLMLGRLKDAIAGCEHLLDEIDQENVFARSLLVQCAYLAGESATVDEHLNAMKRMTPSDPSALVKALETLGKLGRHGEILELADAHTSMFDRDCAYFTGIAAANLGDMQRAARDLKRAAKSDTARQLAASMLRHIERRTTPATIDGSFPYLSHGADLVPPGLWQIASTQLRDAIDRHGLDDDTDALRPEHIPELSDVIVMFTRIELDNGAEDAERLLGVVGLLGTPASIQLLRDVATSSWGTEATRMQAAMRLQQLGAVDGEPMSMLVGEERRMVSTIGLHLDPTAIPDPLPEPHLEMFARAAAALGNGDLDSAEQLMLELMHDHGEHPVVRQNYAAVLGRTGRHDDAIEVQRGTVARHPDYLPGRTTLALAHIEAGDIDEAKELLHGYKLPERVHPSHYAGYLTAQAMLALSDTPPDTLSAERMIDMAAQLDADDIMVDTARQVLAAVKQLTR